MTRKRGGAFCLIILAVLGAAGCGRGTKWVEVEGVVKLDGRPLGNVQVEFLPDPEEGTQGPRSTAVTDPDGNFTLVADNQKKGAVVGSHRVLIRDLQPYGDKFVGRKIEAEAQEGVPRPPSRVPAVYSDSARTPLKEEIQSDRPTVEVNLSSTPGTAQR